MIYVTGDTHGGIDIAKLNSESFSVNRQLSKDDYVIVAGDFGFVWDGPDKDKYWLDWFQERNFTTLFVDGNHENFDQLNSYPVDTWHGGKAHVINDSVIHLMRGQVFDLDGLKIFTFGGAKSKGIERRKENVSWWKEEMPSQEEYEEGIRSLEKHDWTVDYIISHICPKFALGQINSLCGINAKANGLNQYFNAIYERVTFKHWYFGHFHADRKLSDKLTLLFNKVEKLKLTESFTKECANLEEEIEKLLEDLSGDNSKDVVDKAMDKLIQISAGQDDPILIPFIEDAVRKAAFESDFIWLAWLKELVQKMSIEELLSPKTSSLLNFEEMLGGIQF